MFISKEQIKQLDFFSLYIGTVLNYITKDKNEDEDAFLVRKRRRRENIKKCFIYRNYIDKISLKNLIKKSSLEKMNFITINLHLEKHLEQSDKYADFIDENIDSGSWYNLQDQDIQIVSQVIDKAIILKISTEYFNEILNSIESKESLNETQKFLFDLKKKEINDIKNNIKNINESMHSIIDKENQDNLYKTIIKPNNISINQINTWLIKKADSDTVEKLVNKYKFDIITFKQLQGKLDNYESIYSKWEYEFDDENTEINDDSSQQSPDVPPPPPPPPNLLAIEYGGGGE